MRDRFASRIVCLTEETTETLYLLGEEDRIVGISGFTVRPARARREKPKVSGFTSAKIDKILALEPDLVLGFSDLQADIAMEIRQHPAAWTRRADRWARATARDRAALGNRQRTAACRTEEVAWTRLTPFNIWMLSAAAAACAILRAVMVDPIGGTTGDTAGAK